MNEDVKRPWATERDRYREPLRREESCEKWATLDLTPLISAYKQLLRRCRIIYRCVATLQTGGDGDSATLLACTGDTCAENDVRHAYVCTPVDIKAPRRASARYVAAVKEGQVRRK